MRNVLALIAITSLILFGEAFTTNNKAMAASGHCVSGCAHWCASRNAWKNSTSCNEMCQAKHCR
jgi:hypothetical protein